MESSKPVVFVIDPVADFIVKGSSFEIAYGEDDLLPLKNVVHCIEEKIRGDFQRKFLWVLITSIYSKNQFSHPKLKELCTTEEKQKSLIDESLFDFHVIKKTNWFFDMHSTSKDNIKNIINQNNHFIVSGLTVQHCVKKSTEQLEKYLNDRPNTSITVIRELVSGRNAGKEKENSILDTWKRNNPRIQVIDTFEDYTF